MRVEQSLISGFGAAASLVAAIACASLVTATLVTFNGWPHARAAGAPRALVIASNPERVAPIVAGARRIRARVHVRPVHHAAPRRVARPPAVHLVDGTTAVPVSSPVGSSEAMRLLPVRPKLPLPKIVKTPLTTRLADSAQGVTTTLGDTVSGAGNGLGNALAPVSQPVGSLVKGLSAGIGGTVTVVGQTLAAVLRGLTPTH